MGGSSWRSLACLLLLAVFAVACGRSKPGLQRSVLLITVDTLRADFVHAYGFEAANTPHIDDLAQRGALFENAIAAATMTAPAHASIMTSRYAREHSVGTLNGETRLEGAATLAESFEAAGYDTAAFVSNMVLQRRLGLDRGFRTYDDALAEGEVNRPAYFERIAERTVERAIAWLRARAGSHFFLWVHLQDPHGPYDPPAAFRGRVGRVTLRATRPLPVLSTPIGRAGIPDYQVLPDLRQPGDYAGRYAEEIMYADHWIGRLLDAVAEEQGDRGTVILLTADHGESMGEAGWFFQHGQSTTPELARVPFIIVAPGVESRRYETLVSHVDVAPTLLDLAGLPALERSSGVSLLSLLESRGSPRERLIFCDTEGEAAAYSAQGFPRVGGSLIAPRAGKTVIPLQFEAQRQSVDGQWRPSDVGEQVQRKLRDYITASVRLVPAAPMEPEEIEQLRALGYLPRLDAVSGPEAAVDAAGR